MHNITAVRPVILLDGSDTCLWLRSRRATELVLDWAELHQSEILHNWERCQNHQQPVEIPPLE